MDETPNAKTSLTLLGKLRAVPGDTVAWCEFVDWYGEKIYQWCRAWGLQEADARDVTQEVFLKLSARMKDFQYDPSGSFRAWLKTVTHHAWHDYLVKKRKPGDASGGDRLADVAARDDLERSLDAAAEQELLKEASARIRLRIEPRTWQAFHMLAVEGRSGADTAKALGMKVATVYVARSKVQRMLRDEVARLDPP